MPSTHDPEAIRARIEPDEYGSHWLVVYADGTHQHGICGTPRESMEYVAGFCAPCPLEWADLGTSTYEWVNHET
jgi:hypothetical protein